MLAPGTSLPLSRGSTSSIRDKPPAADRHPSGPVDDLVPLEDPGAAIMLGGGNKAKKSATLGVAQQVLPPKEDGGAR